MLPSNSLDFAFFHLSCPPQDIGIIFVEKNVNWLSYSSGQRFLMFSTERLGLSSKDAITFLWRMHCPCLSRHIIFPSTKITSTAVWQLSLSTVGQLGLVLAFVWVLMEAAVH